MLVHVRHGLAKFVHVKQGYKMLSQVSRD